MSLANPDIGYENATLSGVNLCAADRLRSPMNFKAEPEPQGILDLSPMRSSGPAVMQTSEAVWSSVILPKHVDSDQDSRYSSTKTIYDRPGGLPVWSSQHATVRGLNACDAFEGASQHTQVSNALRRLVPR